MSNTFDKLSVLDSFIEEVNSYLPEIETNLERLAQSPGDMDALEETHRRTHTIGGSASMMDFPGLAHVAHGMEDVLVDAIDGLIALDEPVLGLLRRSLGRLRQLLEGIRSGINEDAVIAEDDADYAQYRALIEHGQESVAPHDGAASPAQDADFAPAASQPPVSPTIPSFDEVLASFRSPSVMPGEEVEWPEEPVPAGGFDTSTSYPHVPVSPALSEEPVGAQPSALDALVASTRQSATPVTPPSDQRTVESVVSQPVMHHPEEQMTMTPLATGNEGRDQRLAMGDSDTFYQAYDDVQRGTQVLAVQASSLQNLVTQLRTSMAAIERQRSEFKSFLDGSKDALDRMEDWAGQAMGLNLRNSPEQVRRYLPLSVMWVSNSKLKKVLDQLNRITSGVEVTEDQISSTLEQVHTSLAFCNEAFRHLQQESTHAFKQEAGWTPWGMQFTQDSASLRERVTFERQGDPIALRAQIEAELREELRREYESRPISLAVRAEMEQQIREELRREFEERRSLHERMTGMISEQALQELRTRLRNEIEIQVRQEFLSTITAGEGQSTMAALAQPAPEVKNPVVSNFKDRAVESAGLSSPVPTSPYTWGGHTQPVVDSTPAVTHLPSSSVKSVSASASTADFGEEAVEVFRLEAEELLQTISVHVAALEKSPDNRDLLQGVRRAIHTLKGSAGMMGFRTIADLCHISEDLLDSIMEGKTAVSSAVVSIILDTAEMLDTLFTGHGSDPAADEAKLEKLRARYAELIGEPASSRGSVDEDIDAAAEGVYDAAALVSDVVAEEQEGQAVPQRAGRGDLSVRVRLQKLDELVNLFGEMLVNRSVLEERIQRLVRLVSDVGVSSNRLRDVGQKLESRFEAATLPSGRSVQVMPGEGKASMLLNSSQGAYNNNGKNALEASHLEEFDELELDRYTEFHQLARGLSEGISDMATLSGEMDAIIRECESVFSRENRLSATFQDRLMKVRLVPISTMTPRLYRAARSVALKQHKEFEFLLEGEATEVDRTVSEEITGPLLHLVRNAVNHALETPEERTQIGKPPVGQIKLSAAYEGNQVVITVRDDGKGIDPESVRQSAVNRGLIRPDQPLSDSDLIDLIFRSGFSTAKVLSEESGRGVGLDVVRDSVSRLRGTLVVESTPGQGTAFIMKFPTSLAIQRAMMVSVAGQQFAIPTIMVETIGRLDNFKRGTLAGQPAVIVHNDYYQLQTLAQYLSLPPGAIDDKSPLLLISAGGQRVALAVDDVKGQHDIVMKSLGPHLRNVHGIAGGTVLGNGRVVLILELADLLAHRSRLAGMAIAGRTSVSVKQSVDVSAGGQGSARVSASNKPERGKHILVVDDSPSVRRVVGGTLKQHGWEVQMARDGVEALEFISYETPAAVLLDIEMPRMDGYELISTIRAQEQYRTLPLVVLTSRAATKHQQRAMQLGASAYVVKPYQDEELLNTLNGLVYGAVVR